MKEGDPMSRKENLHQLVTTALFAAAITVMTAYMLHIPIPTGGYIHLGDTLIYLAACLLPFPYAAAAATIRAKTVVRSTRLCSFLLSSFSSSASTWATVGRSTSFSFSSFFSFFSLKRTPRFN